MEGQKPKEEAKGFRFRTGGFEIVLQIAVALLILLVIQFCTSG